MVNLMQPLMSKKSSTLSMINMIKKRNIVQIPLIKITVLSPYLTDGPKQSHKLHRITMHSLVIIPLFEQPVNTTL